MSKVVIALKIDVTKIDKARLFKGQKGTYLDAIAVVDLGEPDQYGNHGMITQSVSKEEKAAGERGAILGNGKIIARLDDGAPRQAPKQQSQQTAPPDDFDEVPF
jgi:hypothetical protein